jgi:hypothetical protein
MIGLRFLIRICTDLGMKEVAEYTVKLARVEKNSIRAGSALQRDGSLMSVRAGSTYDLPNEEPIQGYLQGLIIIIIDMPIKKQIQVSKKQMEEVTFDDDVTGLLPE